VMGKKGSPTGRESHKNDVANRTQMGAEIEDDRLTRGVAIAPAIGFPLFFFHFLHLLTVVS